MRKIGLKVMLGGMVGVACFAATAASASPAPLIMINGVEVHSAANYQKGDMFYVDTEAYSRMIGASYTFDSKQKVVTVKGKPLKAEMKNGVPVAELKQLATIAGAEQVTIDPQNGTAYVLDLPDGTVQMTPSVPGMGEHWANPAEMPTGPIYGVENGKLVFIEQMLPQSDFAAGKSWVNILGMKGLPSPAVQHTDIEFQPHGHEGMEIPHYDLHHYFVTHEEHLSYGLPKKE